MVMIRQDCVGMGRQRSMETPPPRDHWSRVSSATALRAQASSTRHVARLAQAGVLDAVAECRVRGAVERTYALRPSDARIRPEEAAAMTSDEHEQAFLAYVAGLLADFDRYLSGAPDPGRDGASYQVAGMWLTDEEFADFARAIAALAAPRLANPPAPGRRRRLLYTVVLPTPGEPSSDSEPVADP